MKVQEQQQEKEYLQQRVATLEKNNKELYLQKKSLEDEINKVMQETDDSKRLTMINTNLYRRKSLLRIDSSKIGGV